jgi:hypothetical protein
MSSRDSTGVVEQEPEGLRGRLVGTVIAVTAAVTVLCSAVVVFMLRSEREALHSAEAAPGRPMSATVGGVEQLALDGPPRGLDEAQRGRHALDDYGWVDRQRGIARIPIDRAMSWVVEDAARAAASPGVLEFSPDGGPGRGERVR